MEGKKTRGKQKREMKKIDNERDLSITFTKRKSGINKKASELSTLTGAIVDVLMFSPSGNSFSYGDPSLQSMTRTSLDERHPSEGSIYNQLVEDRKRREIQQLNVKHDALMDQLYAEKAREKVLERSLKTRNSSGWWEDNVQDLGYEQAKAMEVSFVEFEKKLIDELSIKSGVNVSHDLAPMDQSSGDGANSYLTHEFGGDISEIVFGAKNSANLIGTSESMPNFYFTHTNEEQTFNLIPCDEQGGELFDVVFPPKSQALGASFSLDNANGSGKSSFTSLPTNQTPGLNLTDASGSGNHALVFSPFNQYQGDNPFLCNTGNENSGGSGGHTFFFSPSNQFQGNSPFLFNASNENSGGSGGHALAFPPSIQCQGDHPFQYNTSNGNADGNGSHALNFSLSNQHQEANTFLFHAIQENGGFSFPPINGYGHGYF